MNAEDDGLHLVRLTSYYLSSYQTRLGDFDLFQQLNGRPIMFAEDRDEEALKDWFQADKPAPTKDWQQAKDYCNWLGISAACQSTCRRKRSGSSRRVTAASM